MLTWNQRQWGSGQTVTFGKVGGAHVWYEERQWRAQIFGRTLVKQFADMGEAKAVAEKVARKWLTEALAEFERAPEPTPPR